MASAELGPRDVGVLGPWNPDAHDRSPFCPSTQSHFLHPLSPGPSNRVHIPDQVSTFLLVLPLCLCFSLTTSLSISSFHSLGLAQFPYHKFNVSLPACLFLHLSPGFRISALCMQPCPGAQGTPVSPSLMSCFVPGPDHNGGESPLQQLFMLTFARGMLAACGQPDLPLVANP